MVFIYVLHFCANNLNSTYICLYVRTDWIKEKLAQVCTKTSCFSIFAFSFVWISPWYCMQMWTGDRQYKPWCTWMPWSSPWDCCALRTTSKTTSSCPFSSVLCCCVNCIDIEVCAADREFYLGLAVFRNSQSRATKFTVKNQIYCGGKLLPNCFKSVETKREKAIDKPSEPKRLKRLLYWTIVMLVTDTVY